MSTDFKKTEQKRRCKNNNAAERNTASKKRRTNPISLTEKLELQHIIDLSETFVSLLKQLQSINQILDEETESEKEMSSIADDSNITKSEMDNVVLRDIVSKLQNSLNEIPSSSKCTQKATTDTDAKQRKIAPNRRCNCLQQVPGTPSTTGKITDVDTAESLEGGEKISKSRADLKSFATVNSDACYCESCNEVKSFVSERLNNSIKRQIDSSKPQNNKIGKHISSMIQALSSQISARLNNTEN